MCTIYELCIKARGQAPPTLHARQRSHCIVGPSCSVASVLPFKRLKTEICFETDQPAAQSLDICGSNQCNLQITYLGGWGRFAAPRGCLEKYLFGKCLSQRRTKIQPYHNRTSPNYVYNINLLYNSIHLLNEILINYFGLQKLFFIVQIAGLWSCSGIYRCITNIVSTTLAILYFLEHDTVFHYFVRNMSQLIQNDNIFLYYEFVDISLTFAETQLTL